MTGSVGVDGLVEVTGVLADADGDALALADGLALLLDGDGLGEPYPPGVDGLGDHGADGLGAPYPPGVDGLGDDEQDDWP
ncbi:hypothetical protein Athai_40630 [Actinocatenispora thailandica]|uniref:Uncharacterized protein n=1 Tax=Actinocatenispora thailandica TaxID=227318 RepID=A0A7R7DS01_9ACTN|nr:hypothetical protein [Actinocatenispora thailandica]BCJ36560.1 hypothetical protein Athai_40630 [Actinocatenispora thailandica]